jgi:hypothetical protein
LKGCQPPISVKEAEGQVLLKPDAVQSSEGRKEVDGGMVTAHEDVLAVIHHGTRCGIKEGARPSAEVGLLFEQAHTTPLFGQCDTGPQARKATADDQDFVRHESRNQDSGFSNQEPDVQKNPPVRNRQWAEKRKGNGVRTSLFRMVCGPLDAREGH